MRLAIAGTTMQGVVRNPLASPYTLGIASAASFGATLAIILGAGFVTGKYIIIVNAFVFALLSSFIIYGLSRYRTQRRSTAESFYRLCTVSRARCSFAR
ncbi:hypothetical protein CW713_10165 [Methanophagales archaeon]|nr:MAG: hypothetical protein CW713_10165 [Methanophagales archaeon]